MQAPPDENANQKRDTRDTKNNFKTMGKYSISISQNNKLKTVKKNPSINDHTQKTHHDIKRQQIELE